jgi:hypothetical protein
LVCFLKNSKILTPEMLTKSAFCGIIEIGESRCQMDKYQQKIIEAFDIMLDAKLKEKGLNLTIVGKVVNLSPLQIKYNGEIFSAESEITTLSTDDIVYILTDLDFSYRLIIARKE